MKNTQHKRLHTKVVADKFYHDVQGIIAECLTPHYMETVKTTGDVEVKNLDGGPTRRIGFKMRF